MPRTIYKEDISRFTKADICLPKSIKRHTNKDGNLDLG